jgi:hypothetical protein
MIRAVASMIAVAGLAGAASAQSLVPLSTFGTNGWRAPGVSYAGDSAGAVSGTPGAGGTYLGLNGANSNTERGMAYNPATGDLILVTRNGTIAATATRFRILDGTTGIDKGGLNEGSGVISGGTFPFNTVGVSADGAIYVNNLSADTRTSAFKVYKWASQTASSPTVHFSATQAFGTGSPAPRLGDSLDVIGSGANTKIVAGYAGVAGYTVITGDTSPTAQVYSSQATPAAPGGSLPFTGSPPGGQFRLGLTFAGDGSNVWGNQTGGSIYRSTISGAGAAVVGGTGTTSLGEAPLDYAVIGGVPYVASLDVNNNRVYVYNVSDPNNPVSLFQFGVTATTGSAIGNGNATGSVQWAAIDDVNQTARLYVLNTNNGIQAFTFTVPAPGAAGLVGVGGLVAARRRRR